MGHTWQESAIQSPYWINTPTAQDSDSISDDSIGYDSTGYIMVDTHRQPERAYGDDEIITAGKIKRIGQNIYCPFYAVDDKSNALQLHLQAQTATPHRTSVHDTLSPPRSAGETMINVGEDKVNASVHECVNELSGLTVMSAEIAPDFLFHLTITGIVLPRIKIRGIQYWLLHLNAQGMPAEADETVVYQLRGGHNDGLEWRECATERWENLDSQTALPFFNDA